MCTAAQLIESIPWLAIILVIMSIGWTAERIIDALRRPRP